MKLSTLTKVLSVLVLNILMVACASSLKLSTPTVQIAGGKTVHLPSPSSYNYDLTASQLIEATWVEDDTVKSSQLPVQLQVTGDKLVLAAFSSWGTRILSVTYQGDSISTNVMPGLSGALPPPEQVLFNLMITIWPRSAWEESLSNVRWKMNENDDGRAIFDENGRKVINIQYKSHPKLDGDIVFHHLVNDYTIVIKTLQHQKTSKL
ncbi:hypothetical protein BCS93_04470 [Vibrio breoganii]|uniref:DUF3261 domain-containing protein n=1 Tax=Vibrio breoganii TaxID=553239 RepID=A0AAP8N049_9VIBR|nr:DUF3261 domain-containing protein [Vibrio breoganii]OED84842.1 hypothetical protein A1QE_02525 [Vibrio breoganii ZF-55]PMP14048.1 hypothetical protein BCS93_04470 [Vibrio breoganii]